MSDISIVPIREDLIESHSRCLDSVARERRYIGLVEGPTLAETQEFVRKLLATGGVQYVALEGDGRVVGWCDIMRLRIEGFRHVGQLGMGLLSSVRGRGIGRRLAEAALRAAIAQGMERIELDVFASNAPAIALYDRLGFVREGVRRRARKLDGRYEDILLMALMPNPQDSASE